MRLSFCERRTKFRFLDMLRSCVRFGSVVVQSLPEQLVKEVQSSGWSRGVDSRLTKNLHRFSPRQCALILNGLSRHSQGADQHNDSLAQTRRLVFLLSQKLMPEMSQLTLRDLALIIHGMWKLGLRNEIFISESLEAVERK